jgi:hypothetical protein
MTQAPQTGVKKVVPASNTTSCIAISCTIIVFDVTVSSEVGYFITLQTT